MTKAEQRQKSMDLSMYMPLKTGLSEKKKPYRFCQDSGFTHIHLFLIANELVCARVRIISVLGTSFSYTISNKISLCALLLHFSSLLLNLKKRLFCCCCLKETATISVTVMDDLSLKTN